MVVGTRVRVEVVPVDALARVAGRAEHRGAVHGELEAAFEPLGDPAVRSGAEGDTAPARECGQVGARRFRVGGRKFQRGAELRVRPVSGAGDRGGDGEPVGEQRRRANEHPR